MIELGDFSVYVAPLYRYPFVSSIVADVTIQVLPI